MGVCGDVIGPMQRKPRKAGQSSCAHWARRGSIRLQNWGSFPPGVAVWGWGSLISTVVAGMETMASPTNHPIPVPVTCSRCTHGGDNSL